MNKLIHSIDKVVEHLFIGNSYRDLTISGRIYKKERKFLGFDLKPKYFYTISIPLLEDPFYDGEFATNRILKSYSIVLKQELVDKIKELEENVE